MMACWVRGKCIGRGSFGTVSLAFDRRNGAVFAVKSVETTNSSLSYHLECLESEIRILRSLSSPYVVKYYGDDTTAEGDSNNTTTCCYRNLHMEYLPGGSVADVAALRGGGKLSDMDDRVLRSHVWCLVSALQYVHSGGIVHCDVKGRNVLVGEDPMVAKLADFGSAVEFGRGPPRGSPLWMAPEVVRGESQGPESDLWSLGCTVIEMVTGKPAWEDRGVDTLSRIGFSDELPEFPAELSQLGRDFLEKCLKRDPRERWTCDQLLQHPFIANSSPVDSAATVDSSPRCVLDWVNSEFEAEHSEDEDEDWLLNWDSGRGNVDVSFRDRIVELSTSGGAKWESDGWVAVRTNVACAWDEAGRPGTEYTNLMRTESESESESGSGTAGTSLDCCTPPGAKVENLRTCLECSNSGGALSLKLNRNYNVGPSCGIGAIGIALQLGCLAVITKDTGLFRSSCIFLLFLYYLFAISRNNNNNNNEILFLFIYIIFLIPYYEFVFSRTLHYI